MNRNVISRIIGNTASNILDEPIKLVQSTLSGLIWYKVDASSWRWCVKQDVLTHHFKHLPRIVDPTLIDSNDKRAYLDMKCPGKIIDVCVYNGTMIWLEYECKPRTNDDTSSYSITIVMKVIYNKRNINNLNDFIRMMLKESKRIEAIESKNVYRRVSGNYSEECPNRPKRTFNDVFIPQKQEEQIVNSVKAFCNSEKWYKEHCIPYHYGIMLHGNPGTGKSSVVQAIINLMDCDVFYIPSDKLSDSVVENGWLRYASRDRMRVVIIEDLDTGSFIMDRSKETDPNSFRNRPIATIGTFLNMIDGFANHEKVIYIFTTNHLEKLDPAIIRPGRIDLLVEIGYVTDETFAKFCQFHYGKIPDKNYHIRDKVTCAELQTHVMTGSTFEQILEEYEEEAQS